MKNSQLAVLCGGHPGRGGDRRGQQLVHGQVAPRFQRPRAARASPLLPAVMAWRTAATSARSIAMMPKSKGNAYFIACRKGAEEAAKELGVDLLWDGPTDPDPAKQNEIVDAWITRGVDVIAVAVENRRHLDRPAQSPRTRHQSRDLGRGRRTGRPRLLRATRRRRRASAHAHGHSRPRDGRQGRVRDHHRLADRRQHDEWQKHIEARMKEKYPDIQPGRPPSLRRQAEQAPPTRRTDSERVSEREADHGDLLAGRPRRGRGGQAVGPQRREGDRPGPAEPEQAVRPRGLHRT